MFAMNDNPLGKGFAVFAYELRSGAADGRPVSRVLAQVAARAPVILVRPDGRHEVWSADPTLAPRFESG